MSLMEAVGSVFRQYGRFRGRARRSEYWKFWFFNILVYAVILVGSLMIGGSSGNYEVIAIVPILLILYSVITILPSFALLVRRLHDTGKSGAFVFFLLLPVIGEILLLVWTFQDGQPCTNAYGPDPKGREYYGSKATSIIVTPETETTEASDKSTESESWRVTEKEKEKAAERKKGPEKTIEPEKKAETKTCKSCGAAIASGAKFCGKCGAKQGEEAPESEESDSLKYLTAGESDSTHRSEKKRCISCGMHIDVWVSTCPFCGKDQNEGEDDEAVPEDTKGVFYIPHDLD